MHTFVLTSETTPTGHTHRYVKGTLPCLPYCGCDPVRLHLLPERRPHPLIHIDASVEVHTYLAGNMDIVLHLAIRDCSPCDSHLTRLQNHMTNSHVHVQLYIHVHTQQDEPDGCPTEKVGVSRRWHKGGVIVYSEEAGEDLYHLLLPLRAHYLHTAQLRHILLLLGKE